MKKQTLLLIADWIVYVLAFVFSYGMIFWSFKRGAISFGIPWAAGGSLLGLGIVSRKYPRDQKRFLMFGLLLVAIGAAGAYTR